MRSCVDEYIITVTKAAFSEGFKLGMNIAVGTLA